MVAYEEREKILRIDSDQERNSECRSGESEDRLLFNGPGRGTEREEAAILYSRDSSQSEKKFLGGGKGRGN